MIANVKEINNNNNNNNNNKLKIIIKFLSIAFYIAYAIFGSKH